MVERLKSAIEKARAQREGYGQPAARASAAASGAAAAQAAQAAPEAALPAAPPELQTEPLENWQVFKEIAADQKRLQRARIVSHDKSDLAYRAFDMLRTRTMHALREKGWKRLAVSAPTMGVGKTVVVLNLAFSLARQAATRVLLFDMDLARPSLTKVLDPDTDADMRAFLTGAAPAESYLRRYGSNLLLGLNNAPVANAAELLQSEDASRILADTIERTRPTVVIFDTSPILVSDDALSVMANVDCAMMVVGAGETKPNDIVESEKLIAEWTDLLGIVLNKSEEKNRDLYGY